MTVYFGIIYGVIAIALLVIVYLVKYVFKQDKGSEEMQEISNAIREGAMAFIKRQYKTIAAMAIAVLIIIVLADYFANLSKGSSYAMGVAWFTGLAFITGAFLLCRSRIYWHVYGSQL